MWIKWTERKPSWREEREMYIRCHLRLVPKIILRTSFDPRTQDINDRVNMDDFEWWDGPEDDVELKGWPVRTEPTQLPMF